MVTEQANYSSCTETWRGCSWNTCSGVMSVGEDAAISKETAKRVVGKPFEPGVSGNPAGRPAVAREFREKCKGFMEEEGWGLLMAIARDAEAKDSRYALELIAAYAYGKPKLGVELTGADAMPLSVVILPAVSIPAAEEVIRKAE